MEKWELQIQGFPAAPDLRAFVKALQAAANVLKGDLAEFETERLFSTLLQSPVNLLQTVLTQFQEEEWSNAIIDAFKLLASVVGKFRNVLEPYFENIIKICELNHMAHVRRNSLLCQCELARVTPRAGSSARRLASELESASTCRSELALLVGTLCEHHPEHLENQYNRIWRTYLGFLSASGTDKFISSVLQGISGLLVSFGRNLPVNELWGFYDTMVRLHARCTHVCIKILSLHCHLFKERIVEDVQTRAELWSIATQDGVADALISVYEAVADVVGNRVRAILNQEVLPHLSSGARLTALNVLSALRGRGFDSDLDTYVDVQDLEFEIRCAGVAYHTADLIIWYIRSGLSHSLRLSQTALLFYQNVPTNKVNDLAAAILTHQNVREETISFLASECCQPNSERYMKVWRALLVDAGSSDHRRSALEEYMQYFTFVLQGWVEDRGEVLPEKLATLLSLTTDILSLPVAEVSFDLPLRTLSEALRRSRAAELLSATAAVLAKGGSIGKDVWPYILVENCRDEASLCACCLLLLHAPYNADQINVLTALQIIFSRNDVEDTSYLRAVQKLEQLILCADNGSHDDHINKAICLVQKLQNRNKMADKDARILKRHVTMFLGKYGGEVDTNNNNEVNMATSKLKDTLFLAIPHLEGERVKINLKETLKLATEEEDPDALLQLLKIICATVSTRREPAILTALSLCCRAICRAVCRGAITDATGIVQRAILYCDTPQAVHDMLTIISEEQSPGVRKLLCGCLPAMLSDDLMASTLSRATGMMGGSGTIKRAALDIIDAIIPSIEDNHNTIKTYLSSVLEAIAKANELEANSTFEISTKLYIEKLELFNNEDVDNLLMKFITHLIVRGKIESHKLKTFKNMTDLCLKTAKIITDFGKITHDRVVEMVFDTKSRESDFFKTLYVLAILKNKFELTASYSSRMFFNKTILNELYDVDVTFSEDGVFEMEAILVFMTEYAEALLEYSYDKTTKLLSSIIKYIPHQYIIYHEHNLKICLPTYKAILKTYPRTIEDSFESWLTNIVPEIQEYIKDSYYHDNIKALIIYLDISGFYLHSLMNKIKMWPKYILKKYINGATGAELSFLTECLTAAVKVTGFDVKSLLLEGKAAKDYVGVKFCGKFMKVLLRYFLKKPYVLLDVGCEDCCAVLDDVVKCCVKRKCAEDVYDQVLHLVNELWPTYDTKTNFHQKCELLTNVSCLPRSLGRDSNPMQWVAAQLRDPGNRDNNTRLVGVLPGGDEFNDCYALFADNCLNATLSECSGAALRAALDALAANPATLLLRVVATLAATDEEESEKQVKWWDTAMDSCCASLARVESFNACDTLLAISDGSLSLGVCRRLMLPLLRYSTASYCEQFFSRHLNSLLGSLKKKPRDIRAGATYQQCIVVYKTRALLLLQVAFEKIPLSSLQSPQSVLYRASNLDKPTSNYLTSTVCILCVTLRKDDCPSDADDSFKKSFRRYQCAIYNCLCAAICKSKPADKFYNNIFGSSAWDKIVDDQYKYYLPVVKRRRKTRQSVSISTTNTIGTTSTPTTRTKMFLRTLSEDPNKFDLYGEESEQVEVQEVQITDSEINKHWCASTLTALLAHTQQLPCWQHVCKYLTTALTTRAGHLLAQCICNCHEVLTPHASELRPALLAFIASTLQDGLNGLHVDILETLIYWRDDPTLPESSLRDLQSTVEALITQTIQSRDPFLQILDNFLEIYAKYVTVDWRVFAHHINTKISKCLPIIQRLAKHKIHIPELVPTLVQMDLKIWLENTKMAECFGAALSCVEERDGDIQSFRDMLKRVKQRESYIKMLYYAQLGCEEICDAVNFRQVTDQTRKLPKPLQNKCLHIISTYISQQPIDYTTSIFDTIELNEFLTTDNIEALSLVASGLRFMDEALKRRVVRQALEYCSHSVDRVRKAAFKVAARAFEEIFPAKESKHGEPSAKRLKKSNTLLNIMNETDPYILNVVARVADGVTSYNDDVTSVVRKVLSKDTGERLAECISLLLSGNISDLSVCAPLLELFFAELRTNDAFLTCKLRDEPLEPIEPKGASKLFTDTKSCRGTLLSYRVSAARRPQKTIQTPAAEVDVQVSIDSILEALLLFAKRHHQAALALTLQVVLCLPGRRFDASLATVLCNTLPTPSDATPLYVQLGRCVVDTAVNIPKFERAVDRLHELTSESDDADLVACLREEILMRKAVDVFQIRSAPMPNSDVVMEETRSFSIQDLTSCFGRLSNWDDLTIQERAAKTMQLPMLWTDEEGFIAALDVYRDSVRGVCWFDKLVSSYYDDTKDSARWLRDVTTWPRRAFQESAVVEALSWHLDSEDAEPWRCRISPRDCLVQWAARLMIRASQAKEREPIYPSHSNELQWCVRANEMGLHRAVLECCDRNSIVNLPEEDKMSWYHQKLISLRGIALERNDSELLRETLRTAVELVSDFPNQTSDSVGICKQIFLLQQSRNEQSTHSLNDIMKHLNKPKENGTLSQSKPACTSFYELALVYYDQQWSDDITSQDEVIKNLSSTLYRMRDSNLGPQDKHVALLLNRLLGYSGTKIEDTDVKNKILRVFYPEDQYFDDFTTEQIDSTIHLLGRRPGESSQQEYKKLFATIRDVGHCLSEYCKRLVKAVNNKGSWGEVFARIRDMMENPYVGSDYHLLRGEVNKLYAIEHFESSTTDHKLAVVKSVMITLDVPPKSTLRVSQLCATLTHTHNTVLHWGRATVMDQVTVITKSVRRPCILTLRCEDGKLRRLLHKCGEPLAMDASRGRVDPSMRYKVIPTSADSGLMEFLEDHQTLHQLISSVCDLDEIYQSVQRPFDDELIVSPSPHTFQRLREKVPVHALRTAMERNSSCLEEFLMKKRNFQDSLASIAIYDWILGVCDRHLENFLCSVNSGRLVSIDGGATLQYQRELPPARLTPCLLAGTAVTVLESRLQTTLSALRESQYLFCNFVKMTFRWNPTLIDDKLPYIQALVSGRALSLQVCRSLLQQAPRPYLQQYLDLIDSLMPEIQEQYTVQEQIASFLVHCTEPRILHVTRGGWMPWV